MGRNAKDKRDIYYRLAKQKNLRSRSAFKLIQIDYLFKLFENLELEDLIIDLCSSPGGWSQVSSEFMKKKFINQVTELDFEGKDSIEKINSKVNDNNDNNVDILKDKFVVSIDVQKMLDLEGVYFIQGDITNQGTIEELLNITCKRKIKLVICDGAPDIICLPDFDNYVQNQLVLCALNFSIKTLINGGTFVSKVYRGFNFIDTINILKCFYKKINIAKPKTSRNASFEAFIVCEDYDFNLYLDLLDKCSFLKDFLGENDLNLNFSEQYQSNFSLLKIKISQFLSTKLSTNRIDDEDIIHMNEIPFIKKVLTFIQLDLLLISNNLEVNFENKSQKNIGNYDTIFIENIDGNKFKDISKNIPDKDSLFLLEKIKMFVETYTENEFDFEFNNTNDICYFSEENLDNFENIELNCDKQCFFHDGSLKSLGVNFYQVGEEDFDSDKTYDLESTNYNQSLNPTQMPIDPPYKKYIEEHKGKVLKKEK